MKFSVIQLNSSDDQAANIDNIVALVEAAVQEDRPDLVILPEMSAFISGSADKLRNSAQPVLEGGYHQAMSALAARLQVNIHAGSSVELRDGACYNTSAVFSRDGTLLGRYSKIHRFDATLPDGTELKESATIAAGSDIVVVVIEGVRVGLAICFDLRFAELFRRLADLEADLIVVPSAFTFQTGADHWEILLRARAIETQCYVAAPGQVGTFDNGKYMNFGHSMIVDPWGLVVAQVSNGPGFVSTRLDSRYMEQVRTRLPVRQNRVLV
ncbi:carbon-nitrogen hydrolase family protein [Sphingosinicella xenopeptidilytica]|uniref:Carbon-nitrogen hydrolase family protein n=1 Tax=Sphingosinicella xenopeptidilytica TaxID=364098 RepID=A0ABW3C4D6_SPHXN